MFAVPGWSVSSDVLKTQNFESTKNTEKSLKPNGNTILQNTTVLPKKRKRGVGENGGMVVTGDNLADLWEKHIEGRTSQNDGVVSGAQGSTKRPGKRKNNHNNAISNAPIVSESLEKEEKPMGLEQVETHRAMKKAKRERKVLQEADGEQPPTKPENTAGTTGKVSDHSRSKTQLVTEHGLLQRLTPDVTYSPNETLSTLTPLQRAMREKLVSSRFRYLNQTLYTTPSTSSFDLFRQNPTFFTEYHEGFRRQVSVWPENPVDGFVRWIKKRATSGVREASLGSQKSQFKKKTKGKQGKKEPPKSEIIESAAAAGIEPLPRNLKTGLCTIADLGCGEGQLAKTLLSSTNQMAAGPVLIKSLNLRIHSFDLAAPSPHITVADIRSLPLPDASVDVSIFCLALMGTNWIEFVEEAWRVLRWKGECWIGEVGSRFATPKAIRVSHSVGNKTKSGIKTKHKNGKARPDAEDDNAIEDKALAEDDGPPSSALAQSSTDVSAFVEVLKTRGFVLASEPELGNKMFVRMRFSKALTPTKGKGVPVQNDAGGQTWGKKKFVERVGDREGVGSVVDEGKVLKPCVYKVR
ncbi:25S rRNA (adenine645-N1)-methyltransferase [Ptychographa xylographoides]|nr:25S rRNA (adenine645-N1)-methyltransferase [Ptychographa xylographoides]